MNRHSMTELTGMEGHPLTVRVPQAVQMLGIGRSKLYELIQSGDIETIKVGRTTLIPVESLQQLVAARRLAGAGGCAR